MPTLIIITKAETFSSGYIIVVGHLLARIEFLF